MNVDEARKALGDGPMRFAPLDERPIADQIAALNAEEKECFDNLTNRWEKEGSFTLSDEMILRFARCSPGKKKFNEKAAWKVMKKYQERYLELKASDLESQLETKVSLFSGRSSYLLLSGSISQRINIFFVDVVPCARFEVA